MTPRVYTVKQPRPHAPDIILAWNPSLDQGIKLGTVALDS